MSTDLAGATALVTGSTSGIGKATALPLAERGAHVIVSGRDEPRGAAVVDTITQSGGQAKFVAADLLDTAEVPDFAKRALAAAGGHIDILVNDAGIVTRGPTPDISVQDLDAAYAVNVKAPFILGGHLAPAMAAKGKGAIVNVGSMAAEFGMPGISLHGATKAALNLLTKAWAAEFGPSGVRVNSVNPGPTRTEETAQQGEALDQFGSLAPAGRAAGAEEIAAAIAYLVSDDASFVHGAIFAVDGGRTAA
ncbi:MAG TPA: SDR family oxidoreductase [Solirubrobacteraceae bacterium]